MPAGLQTTLCMKCGKTVKVHEMAMHLETDGSVDNFGCVPKVFKKRMTKEDFMKNENDDASIDDDFEMDDIS